MDQLCFNSSENLIAIATAVVTGASMVANFLPAPDQITNPVLKFISRVVHFAAVDIVTAKK